MRGGHWELSPRGSPYSCSVGPGRSLKTRGHADGEKRRLSKLRGKQEGMPRRESSGKGPRGRQKAELGLWQMARSSNQAFYGFLSLPGVLYDEVLAEVHGDRIVAERLLLEWKNRKALQNFDLQSQL